jgi:calcineurin-like phosphoesterase family protein
MPETWFISDTHFGHKKILEYEKESRPFKTIEEMNNELVSRWNSVVNDKDIVYHLGDFCFGRRTIHHANLLKGKKRLIMGNHDSYPAVDYLKFFDKLYGAFFWNKCILSHIPIHPNQLGNRCTMNIHGHLHSKKIYSLSEQGLSYENRNYLNVSCEQNNLTPIHADKILERLKELD